MNERHVPYIVAHRGARAHAPENTLAAARLGHAEQSWMWELDTRYSKDGHLVVFHDATLERTTDVAERPEFRDRAPWSVQDFTLAELRTLDASHGFRTADPFETIAVGEVSEEALASYAGEKIPTLEEALRLVRDLDWRVNVEIKDLSGHPGHERVARDVCALVDRMGMTDKVLLSSFQHEYLRQAADHLPAMPRAALVDKVRPENAADVCREAKAVFYHPKHTLVLPGDTDELRQQGILVNVWTVNKPEDMRRVIALGVNAIITDFPKRLREMLANPA